MNDRFKLTKILSTKLSNKQNKTKKKQTNKQKKCNERYFISKIQNE